MGKEEGFEEGKSLEITPTWAVSTVIVVMVSFSYLVHRSLEKFREWLNKTRRNSLLAAFEKIKEELMLFGVLSLLMGHFIDFFAKICVKSSPLHSRFYPCAKVEDQLMLENMFFPNSKFLNTTVYSKVQKTVRHSEYCPEGKESFASYESLDQLHNFIFVLGVTHVSYSFVAIALAMIKIYSWRTWENQARTMAIEHLQAAATTKMRRLTTFIDHHVSHPWSQHRVLAWLLCFSRQFWSSVSRADYMALRFGFITTHELPLTYDFHNYMVRSMEEEFRDIVGISVPFWIYGILCIFLDFHGTHIYFWLSFLPAILILLIGTQLHRVVVKLAVEIMDHCPLEGFHKFNLRDELFWFKRPRFLLRMIQLISFQNAFEMASFIWSLWEIRDSSCFMENQRYLVTRLLFGVTTQIWCSFITFPLYVIVAQMGSRFKKTIVSENVRDSISKWKRRVKEKQISSLPVVLRDSNSTSSLDSMNFPSIRQQQEGESSSSSPRGKKKLKAPLSFYLEDYCSNHEMPECNIDHRSNSDDEDEIRLVGP
ncbi:Mlo-related protein [Corchorus capsularis]|uniref:MLO-like protein n=1 Tax=Corchorus capsularis TaxID=210143 RepID=A0A1R3GCN6_COCAP|nr:Mlo-related protein [Corchorus capsularis]